MPYPQFPPFFLFGTATAAFQIEGSPRADGKGASIWDTFNHKRGKITTGENAEVACDTYTDD
jgi:beta-glucosidase